jgi:RimJ/RimL family protein N-acetyltransferase
MAGMEPVEITEAGLLLRAWRPDDAEAVYQACQDPDIQRWTTLPSPYLMAHAVSFVVEHAPAAWTDGTGAHFAVLQQAGEVGGQLLGSCGLVNIDRRRNFAEVGYWTAPWARGQGVALRSTRAIARWAFTDLKLDRLIWQAEVGNHPSRLVALRAGFRIEGQLRLASRRPIEVTGEPGGGRTDVWIGTLFPGELSAPDAANEPPTSSGAMTGRAAAHPAGPGSVVARRAALFFGAQPVLRATAPGGPIHLRRPVPADAAALVAACRDPESVRWTTVPDPYETSDAEYFVGVHAPGRWTRGDGAVFAIADEDDRPVGTIEVRISPTDPAVADIGYLVAPHARGRGYAPAALRALTEWAIAALVLCRVEVRAEVGNEASMRVARKAGYVDEGVARAAIAHRGQRRDACVYAFTAGDAPAGDVREESGRAS